MTAASNSSSISIVIFLVVTPCRLVDAYRLFGETNRLHLQGKVQSLHKVKSRGSSVSVVSGYGLDDRAMEVRSPAEARGLFL
jgi:hypothetical protein